MAIIGQNYFVSRTFSVVSFMFVFVFTAFQVMFWLTHDVYISAFTWLFWLLGCIMAVLDVIRWRRTRILPRVLYIPYAMWSMILCLIAICLYCYTNWQVLWVTTDMQHMTVISWVLFMGGCACCIIDVQQQ